MANASGQCKRRSAFGNAPDGGTIVEIVLKPAIEKPLFQSAIDENAGCGPEAGRSKNGALTLMPSLRWLLVCSSLLAACEGGTSLSSPARSAEAAPSSVPSVPTTEPRPTASAPAVEIRNGPNPGSFELRANGVIELDPELIVERQLGDGSFQPVQNLDLGSMKLVTSCTQRVDKCVRVDERGLRPLAWSGMSCSSQCNHTCDKNVRLYGWYRFVVRSCDGKTRFEGPVFELAKTP